MNKIFQFICAAALVCGLTACEDFFDQKSDSVIFADSDHLNNATDTIYSVTGIMHKMQALADRTVLLGEVRADLVDINDNTTSDLRDIALFNVSDSNAYNSTEGLLCSHQQLQLFPRKRRHHAEEQPQRENLPSANMPL